MDVSISSASAKIAPSGADASKLFDYVAQTDISKQAALPGPAPSLEEQSRARASRVSRLLRSRSETVKHKKCRSAGLPLCGEAGGQLLKLKQKFTASVRDICSAISAKDTAGGDGKSALLKGFCFFFAARCNFSPRRSRCKSGNSGLEAATCIPCCRRSEPVFPNFYGV